MPDAENPLSADLGLESLDEVAGGTNNLEAYPVGKGICSRCGKSGILHNIPSVGDNICLDCICDAVVEYGSAHAGE